ncbi:protein-glutamine gamma-glutamyltransferase [Domibacillus indicus]|uniref:protein-glutamine gamma-glutamyltransferase n=1 Tax=Domibacillus indicus TaxID=1437523 RepID=UPI000617EAAD|nr:protein-glutamine gamma-glutamyltransferase [Domibacillus indicus]
MIQISGRPFQQGDVRPSDRVESIILQQMNDSPAIYPYQSVDEAAFEVALRKHIVGSARAMNAGNARFAIFENSRCNPRYWDLTESGGFRLERDAKPADAIEDIYLNSSLYAFECATAMIIVYYYAVLNLMGETFFNQFFQNLYLYSWHADRDLGIKKEYTRHSLPGDVVYFHNPDVDPETPHWRGENAVVLEDGTYFGHGIGIKTAEQMIEILNQVRAAEAVQSAYLSNFVTRPSFSRLAKLPAAYTAYSGRAAVLHGRNSISFDQYLSYL